MSVIVSLGIDVFNGKIDDFGKKRCQYQVTKKKKSKERFKNGDSGIILNDCIYFMKFYAGLRIRKGL